MKSKITPKARDKDILIQEISGETILYDLVIDRAYCLNETSSLIWQLCDGSNSVSEITDSLSKHMKTDVSDELVWLAIDQFKKDNLLNDNEIITPAFNGMSRRQVIRKVGLASAIALPIVSSMVMPTPVEGASCLPPGSSCSVATPPLCCETCVPDSGGFPGDPGTCQFGG